MAFVKWVGEETGRTDGGKEQPVLTEGGICTRPAPDYTVVGGFNITPRHDGGYF